MKPRLGRDEGIVYEGAVRRTSSMLLALAAFSTASTAACSSSSTKGEASSRAPAPQASTTEPARSSPPADPFDDVPELLTAGKLAHPPALLAHRGDLPTSVTSLGAVAVIATKHVGPGAARAALAVGFICGGPALGRIAARAPEAKFGVEALVVALSDPHLGDWL
ncbi:MAG: hypothetical protein U0414_22355 [Polyangiaceae bacterium]